MPLVTMLLLPVVFVSCCALSECGLESGTGPEGAFLLFGTNISQYMTAFATYNFVCPGIVMDKIFITLLQDVIVPR